MLIATWFFADSAGSSRLFCSISPWRTQNTFTLRMTRRYNNKRIGKSLRIILLLRLGIENRSRFWDFLERQWVWNDRNGNFTAKKLVLFAPKLSPSSLSLILKKYFFLDFWWNERLKMTDLLILILFLAVNPFRLPMFKFNQDWPTVWSETNQKWSESSRPTLKSPPAHPGANLAPEPSNPISRALAYS